MNRKILIIDDEADIAELIKDCLGDRNLTVFTATDAKEGLAIFDLELPRLVLLDIRLPDMGGLECLKRIKQTAPETVVVILSGMQDEGIAKEAIRRGAYDYLTKPFELERFETEILDRLF